MLSIVTAPAFIAFAPIASFGPGASRARVGSLSMLSEEQAKAKWLASLDTPSWGKSAAAAAVPEYETPETFSSSDEAEAKARWLASLDMEPSWLTPSTVAVLQEACDQGNDEACATLDYEEQAKAKWLASLDSTPSWLSGAPPAAAPVGTGNVVPTGTLSEAEAKARWLSSLDQTSWGRIA